MPEEVKGMLRAMLEEQDKNRQDVKDLDVDVQRLAQSYRRSRWERIAIVVVLLTSIVLVALYIADALQRRAEIRQQLHDLACLAVKRAAPGVSPTADELRNKYGCPPYVAPASTVHPAPTKTVTVSRGP